MTSQTDTRAASNVGTLIDATADWLMSQALGEHSMQQSSAAAATGCAPRVCPSPGSSCVRTLHPLFSAVSLTWRAGQALDVVEHRHSVGRRGVCPQPPALPGRVRSSDLRRRLRSEADTREFPVLKEFVEPRCDGLSRLFGAVWHDRRSELENLRTASSGRGRPTVPDGFGDDDIRALQRIERRLAVACKVNIKDQIARNVLTAYLGAHSGQQVFEGKIQRGDGETIYAVIWFCDLRDSTRLAASLPLQEFFEHPQRVLRVHGGRGARPRRRGSSVYRRRRARHFSRCRHTRSWTPPGVPCTAPRASKALAAARDALARLAKLNAKRNAEGRPALGGGVALHVGDVMYGNIGVPERVEFSVIGPAANTAARWSHLCKTLHSAAGRLLPVRLGLAGVMAFAG